MRYGHKCAEKADKMKNKSFLVMAMIKNANFLLNVYFNIGVSASLTEPNCLRASTKTS